MLCWCDGVCGIILLCFGCVVVLCCCVVLCCLLCGVSVLFDLFSCVSVWLMLRACMVLCYVYVCGCVCIRLWLCVDVDVDVGFGLVFVVC